MLLVFCVGCFHEALHLQCVSILQCVDSLNLFALIQAKKSINDAYGTKYRVMFVDTNSNQKLNFPFVGLFLLLVLAGKLLVWFWWFAIGDAMASKGTTSKTFKFRLLFVAQECLLKFLMTQH